MMRRQRCTKCATSFYTAQAGVTICQNCSGDIPDNTAQAERDAQQIALANSNPKGAPQSYDPRTGLPKDATDVVPVSPTEPTDTSEPPKRRKRRTKAEIEADETTANEAGDASS